MKPKILVLGDLNIDKFIYGSAKRLSPEGPIPVFNPIRETSNLGMAGNVLANMQSLGKEIYDIDFLFCNPCVTTKTRYVDEESGYTLLRVDEFDKNERINSIQLSSIEGDYVAIVIADYNKGFLLAEDIQKISESAKRRNIPSFLDTKKILGSFSKEISFVKINDKEYLEQVAAGVKFSEACENLIVTKGEKGALWHNTGLVVETPKIDVKNVSGAGDSYLASFVLAYLKTNSVEKSMRYANKVAGFAVSRSGVISVTSQEVPLSLV